MEVGLEDGHPGKASDEDIKQDLATVGTFQAPSSSIVGACYVIFCSHRMPWVRIWLLSLSFALRGRPQ